MLKALLNVCRALARSGVQAAQTPEPVYGVQVVQQTLPAGLGMYSTVEDLLRSPDVVKAAKACLSAQLEKQRRVNNLKIAAKVTLRCLEQHAARGIILDLDQTTTLTDFLAMSISEFENE